MDGPRQILIACITLLCAIGLLMVYSASMTSRPTEFETVYVSRHAAFLLLGVVIAAVASQCPAEFWKRAAPYLFLLGLVLLAVVLVPGVGARVKGARRWLRLAGFSFQPSEFMKLALPLWTCALVHGARWPAARRVHAVSSTAPDSASTSSLPTEATADSSCATLPREGSTIEPLELTESVDGSISIEAAPIHENVPTSVAASDDGAASSESWRPRARRCWRTACALIARMWFGLAQFFRTAGAAAPVIAAVPLVAVEPDLGTSAFLTASAGLALFIGGWPLAYFGLSIAAIVPAAGLLLALKPYQQHRIAGFLATWTNFEAAPYQVKQSLIALGSGGWFGTGLGRGWQKLSFLPEANTDFVFAVLGEELGLVGALAVVALWCGVLLAGLRMLSRLDARSYEFQAAFVLLTQIVAQAALNVAVVTAMAPPKGISHPLISSGGSNLVITLLQFGVILSLAKDREPRIPAPDVERISSRAA